MPPEAELRRLPGPIWEAENVKEAGQVSTKCGARSRGWVRLRRIFVQTDDGSVLGMEVHRSDRVQSIKKKLQEALRIPTDQTALSFGDQILEDDLHQLRCDSPVLLARTEIHRSVSTPCLCPKLQPNNAAACEPSTAPSPFEIVAGWSSCSRIKRLIQECCMGLASGVDPVPAQGGLGGAYYFRDQAGRKIAIVKPADEEPLAPNNPRGFVGRRLGQAGLSRSIRVGETGVREVAAYLLDHSHFAQVPATALVKAVHPIFHINSEWINRSPRDSTGAKIGSFQEFVEHNYEASECGSSRFPTSAVHRVGILDVRLFNTDRHAGNILVRHVSSLVGGHVELIPIDHGLCLPESLDEDPYFEWLHWPQASIPFSEEEVEYIRRLEPRKDADMLRKQLPMLKEACIRMMVLCTSLLKLGAEAGLCLGDIGSMMTRELVECGGSSRSEFEKIYCDTVEQMSEMELVEEDAVGGDEQGEEDVFDIEIDGPSLLAPCIDDSPPSARWSSDKAPVRQLFRPVPKMKTVEEQDEVEEEEEAGPCNDGWNPSCSVGNRRAALGRRKMNKSRGSRELLFKQRKETSPPELSNIRDRDWNMFLGRFKSACEVAIQRCKAEKIDRGVRFQQQRLGTSCQF